MTREFWRGWFRRTVQLWFASALYAGLCWVFDVDLGGDVFKAGLAVVVVVWRPENESRADEEEAS